MDDTQKMLKAIINGQSSLKEDLLKQIKKVDEEVGGLKNEVNGLRRELRSGLKSVNQRIDKLGGQLAYLEDDAPTREEFDGLIERVDNLEVKITPA